MALQREALGFRYAERWRVYKETAHASISESSLSGFVKPAPPTADENTHNLSIQSTDHSRVDFSIADQDFNIDPNSFSTTTAQHPEGTSNITLKVFHWHLSGDDISEARLGKRLDRMAHKLVSHLRKSGLKPDVFVFTSTNAITGQGRGEVVDNEYMQNLCNSLWK